MTATDPPTQCAWCFPPDAPGYDPSASHGICARHADELLLLTPLEIAITRLRSNEYLGRDARVQVAENIQTVLARPDRLRMPGPPASALVPIRRRSATIAAPGALWHRQTAAVSLTSRLALRVLLPCLDRLGRTDVLR
jgi:hypothetical protein